MATVPFQTTTTQELAAGSAVQFSSTQVEPVRDTVGDDSERMSQALRNVSQAAFAIQDERDDAESTQLYNNFVGELRAIRDEYKSFKGAEAVKSIKDKGEKIKTTLDLYKNEKIGELFKAYQKQASNGKVRYMFEKMGSVSVKQAHSDMTQHSIVEQRKFKENELYKKIENIKKEASDSAASFALPGSTYQVTFMSGIREIQNYAAIKNWNIDPTQGPVSSHYTKMLNDYVNGVHDSAVKHFKDNNQHPIAKMYLGMHLNGINFGGMMIKTIDGETVLAHTKEIQKAENEFYAEKEVNNILDYPVNSNDNSFLNQAKRILTLDSSHNIDNGLGVSVVDGHNTNEIDTTDRTQSENIEELEKERNKSKFHRLDSNLKLPSEHETTHLFAVSRIGVEKADSLYTKAKSELEIDQAKYKADPQYAREINGKILDNYNSLILDAAEKKYSNKEIEIIKNKIEKLTRPTWKKGESRESYRQRVLAWKKRENKDELESLKELLPIAEEKQNKYIEQIGTDLLNLKKDIKNANQGLLVQVDPKTNMPSLKYYQDKLRETIKDEDKLKYALKHAEDTYTQIKKAREEIYDTAYNKAQDIAFARKNGFKDLKANGIDINIFTKEDQIKLQAGHPDVSDQNAIDEIEANNEKYLENEDSLRPIRHQLSGEKYLYYMNEINSVKTNKAKSAGEKVDSEIFNDGLRQHKLDKLVDAERGSEDKKKYSRLRMKYRDRLNFYYENGIEITYDKRKSILKEILTDDVLFDAGGINQLFRGDTKKPLYATKEKDFERLYVNVGDERVKLHDIPPNVKSAIMQNLLISGEAITYEKIAEEYVATDRPKNSDLYKKKLRLIMMRGN